jgi:hypothetical protein
MKIINVNDNIATVELDDLELFTIKNALNEICHGLRLGDFHPRIGVEKEYAVGLLKQVHKVFQQVDHINL